MSLEQFLKPDDYCIHFVTAFDLIDHVCYIVSVMEKDKDNKRRYTELYTFLDNKEKYFALKDEIDVLIDKYNLQNRLGGQCSEGEEEYSDVEDDLYSTLTYKKYLEHADKLLARDITWSKTYYSYNY
jgi:hypothetical protein